MENLGIIVAVSVGLICFFFFRATARHSYRLGRKYGFPTGKQVYLDLYAMTRRRLKNVHIYFTVSIFFYAVLIMMFNKELEESELLTRFIWAVVLIVVIYPLTGMLSFFDGDYDRTHTKKNRYPYKHRTSEMTQSQEFHIHATT